MNTDKVPNTTTLEQPPPNNLFYFLFGLVVLILNKARYYLKGYTSPRPFGVEQIKQAIDYDINVVDHWLVFLSSYTSDTVDIRDKAILELGPGADLGVGLITLFMGAKQYNALDVNNLVKNVPAAFYDKLFSEIPNKLCGDKGLITYLKQQLAKTTSGNNDKLNYICRDDFDIRVFGQDSIDIVFSQAAIEHFDNIERTFQHLAEVVKSGGILVAEIDLNTHTRWLRDVDPLNIYRFPNWLYKPLMFRGSPNRVRPTRYKKALERCGWGNIYIQPLTKISTHYHQKCRPYLAKVFRSEDAQMEDLTIMVCATKE